MKNQTQIFQVIFLLKTIKELRKIQQIRGKKRKKKKKRKKRKEVSSIFRDYYVVATNFIKDKEDPCDFEDACLQMNQFVGKKKFMINELDSIIKNLV